MEKQKKRRKRKSVGGMCVRQKGTVVESIVDASHDRGLELVDASEGFVKMNRCTGLQIYAACGKRE